MASNGPPRKARSSAVPAVSPGTAAGSPVARGASSPADRVPPHSAEAERGLLGCILLDSARILDMCNATGFKPEFFYEPKHQLIYETLSAMAERNDKVDLLTATSRLRDLNLLDKAGGAPYLQELLDGVITVEHAEYYAQHLQQKYILRSLIDRANQIASLSYDGSEDAKDVLGRAEQLILEIGEQRTQEQRDWGQLIKFTTKEIEQLLDNPRNVTGLSTGYRSLDKILLGLQPGEMIILAARPSMGKTSLAMNVAENVALGFNHDTGYGNESRQCIPVGVFSLEMSGEALVRRMFCSRAKISWERLVNGMVEKRQTFRQIAEAANQVMKAPIFIDDSAGLGALELRARARRMKKMHNIGLIVVDYLQMLNYPQFAKEGRQRETSAISAAMKAMAKELRVPVLVLSQLNRSPETRDKKGVPRISDLRDSGSIEQDADVVMLLRRPCKNKDDPHPNKDDRSVAVVDVAKQRNGRTGEIEMRFEEEHTRFQDPHRGGADEEYSPAPSHGEVEE